MLVALCLFAAGLRTALAGSDCSCGGDDCVQLKAGCRPAGDYCAEIGNDEGSDGCVLRSEGVCAYDGSNCVKNGCVHLDESGCATGSGGDGGYGNDDPSCTWTEDGLCRWVAPPPPCSDFEDPEYGSDMACTPDAGGRTPAPGQGCWWANSDSSGMLGSVCIDLSKEGSSGKGCGENFYDEDSCNKYSSQGCMWDTMDSSCKTSSCLSIVTEQDCTSASDTVGECMWEAATTSNDAMGGGMVRRRRNLREARCIRAPKCPDLSQEACEAAPGTCIYDGTGGTGCHNLAESCAQQSYEESCSETYAGGAGMGYWFGACKWIPKKDGGQFEGTCAAASGCFKHNNDQAACDKARDDDGTPCHYYSGSADSGAAYCRRVCNQLAEENYNVCAEYSDHCKVVTKTFSKIGDTPVCRYQCPANCNACSSDGSTCTTCSANYFLKDDGGCAACKANCAACSDGSTCTTCSANYFKENNECLPSVCTTPTTAAAGYSLSTQFGDNTIANFDLGGLACAAGFSGTVVATACTAHNTAYSVAGCAPCSAGKYRDQIDQFSLYQYLPGSSLSPHTSTCKSCDPGKYSNSSGSTSPCKFCAAGFAFVRSDAICEGCPPGQYQDENDRAYSACAICEGGTFANTPNTPVCKNCPAGKNLVVVATDATLHDEAEDCQLCEAGKYNFQPGLQIACFDCETALQPGATACDGCDPGTFKESGDGDCIECTVGRYSSTRDAEVCTDCPKGYHGVEVTATQARIECGACPRGTFGDAMALENITRCKACAAGRYSDVDSLPAGASVPCKECPTGRWSAATGLQESVGCKNCGAGRYSTSLASTSETACLACSAGQHSATVGLSDPSQCRACPEGYSQLDEGQAFCLQCVPGQHQNQEGQPSCKLCAVNHFANETKMTKCHVCAIGTTAKTEGSTSCAACAAGKFGKAGPTCTKCAAGQFRDNDADATAVSCTVCPEGFYQSAEGRASCLPCVPGKYQDDKNGIECKLCMINHFADETEMTKCHVCAIGTTAKTMGAASCAKCGAGRFGEGCALCPRGWHRPEDHPDLSRCVQCAIGQASARQGAASCSSCDLGTFGSAPGVCAACSAAKYQDNKGQLACKTCRSGKVVNMQQTACETPEWTTPDDCAPKKEFLDDSDPDRLNHACKPCPLGGYCPDLARLRDVRNLAGFWRVPWASDNITFERCPYAHDCLGVDPAAAEAKKSEPAVTAATANASISNKNRQDSTANTTGTVTDIFPEGCLLGTRGPLCSICVEGYNRDMTRCIKCEVESVPLRVSILLAIICLLGGLILYCRRRIRKTWKKYSGLWTDVLRIVSINITFSQINSSLPTVIQVQWPAVFVEFVSYFNFVNIDLLSLVGASCLGDINFQLTFIFMASLPVGIVLTAWTAYKCSHRLMLRRVRTMDAAQKKTQAREALSLLFKLADTDRSNGLDPSEMVCILTQLGMPVSLQTALRISELLGGELDEHGTLVLSEIVFVNGMLRDGNRDRMLALANNDKEVQQARRKSKTMLLRMKTKILTGTSVGKKTGGGAAAGGGGGGTVRGTAAAGRAEVTAAPSENTSDEEHHLSSREKLVQWILQQHIISDSMAGTTQLLLLAHTPVSRKVFHYFHCNELAGKKLLIADYRLDCTSDTYLAFMPVVLIVLFGFIVALPAVISWYLFRNRKELYSSGVYQTIGWLYEPYVRGAEFWEVHDAIMKMILTGLLIYVPPTSRAGVASLVCTVTIANLNFFQPHKNRILFWLTQISFMTTGTKYIMALLLSTDLSESEDADVENVMIGVVLVAMDVTFIVTSVVSMILAFCMLRRSVKELGQEQSKMTPATRVRVTPSESDAANARMQKLRETRIEHGASSEAYKNATEAHQQAAYRR